MGKVKMRVWDVKHGNAIYVRTPNNKHLVFDLGVGDYSEGMDGRSPLETLKNHYGIDKIDYLMITHPHKDHIKDILNLDKLKLGPKTLHRPKSVDLDKLLENVSTADRPLFDRYIKLDKTFVYPASSTNTTSNPENYGGVIFKHFSTPSLIDNINNLSIVTIMKYEGIKVIIPGDNECKSLDELMTKADFRAAVKDCDILIAPHHGRQSAYHSEFVKLANPRITIVSDGSICDTSANSAYSTNSRGLNVRYKGHLIPRKMLTTNSDGEIYIDFGAGNANSYLKIEIK
ncbi:ComEC/Rec2 family competence protein [Parapedobacter soli]|uniref:ComEC/Rec2 family competence protein n=1 Tax=Parapedobacter soli TaxID=416955 RepID=UPI0021CA6416|nr:MBL fold metallo-hydrolase [Parapedobacter soli]